MTLHPVYVLDGWSSNIDVDRRDKMSAGGDGEEEVVLSGLSGSGRDFVVARAW